MSLFEIRLKALSGEELAQFLPGMLVSELFYALPALHMKIPEKSGINLLGKRHGLNTFLIQKMVEVKQHQ